MFRFDTKPIIALLALLLALTGLTACKPTRGTASPEDYYPLIQVALAGGETAAMIGRNEAIKKEDFAGCVAGEATIAALDAAQQVLGSKVSGDLVFPALYVNYSDCMPFADKKPQGREDVAVLVKSVTEVTLQTVKYYATSLYMTDCDKGLRALAALAYVEGMIEPVAMEIADHDGMLEIPAVAVELKCEE